GSSEVFAMGKTGKSNWIFGGGLAAAIAGLCWVFPLFHIVLLEKAKQQWAGEVFNVKQFVETFWTERLMKSLDKAVKVEVLLSAIQSDPAGARKKYGRTLGMSESYTYFVSGAGWVVSVTDKEVGLVITEGGTKPEVVLETGMLFGNAVRDGTGLLDV